ncbi:hypothetical protein SLS58_003920 [Diplodia intermedia]|uniref:SGNH hydrolase-type esterase domain-containing protein n=1 Tax=Diplodia intermedia TaxID=856260 RepID=A0ABR3TVG8_9PEZI
MLLPAAIPRLLLLLCSIAATFTQQAAGTPAPPYEATFSSGHHVDRRRQDGGGANGNNHTAGRWVAAWTAMPQLTEPANLPPAPFNASSVFRNATIRQTIRVTAASSRVRLRLSNAFGRTALPIAAVTVGRAVAPGSPAVDVSTLRALTFSGSPGFAVPAGALVVSDAVDVAGGVAAGDDLSVSVYLADGQAGGAITSHPGSRTTSWMAFGDRTEAGDLSAAADTGDDDDDVASVAHWYFISTLDAWVPSSSASAPPAGTLALVGDSITDGRGSTTDANDRWPDALLDRLQNDSSSSSSSSLLLSRVAIANQAAGGNRVLADGLGPNALGRFDRDVLSQPGVRWALVFEGVNDIGAAADEAAAQDAVGDALIAAYKQFALRAHAAGLPLLGATITPFNAPGFDVAAQPYSGAQRERTRQRVNEFVRNSGGVFDAVVDFDAAVRDPDDETRLRAEYDSGDYLHLNPVGYRAMAEAFPVDALVQLAEGVDGYA